MKADMLIEVEGQHGLEVGEWRTWASCRTADPYLFFRERGDSYRRAREICNGKMVDGEIVGSCAVRAQCLEWALQRNERFGIWGGMTKLARDKYWKRLSVLEKEKLRPGYPNQGGRPKTKRT